MIMEVELKLLLARNGSIGVDIRTVFYLFTSESDWKGP
jgi:hypothetical protein